MPRRKPQMFSTDNVPLLDRRQLTRNENPFCRTESGLSREVEYPRSSEQIIPQGSTSLCNRMGRLGAPLSDFSFVRSSHSTSICGSRAPRLLPNWRKDTALLYRPGLG